MISAEDLLLSYKDNKSQRINCSKNINICYWSDYSSEDDYDKLDFNISKYIKLKSNEHSKKEYRRKSSKK